MRSLNDLNCYRKHVKENLYHDQKYKLFIYIDNLFYEQFSNYILEKNNIFNSFIFHHAYFIVDSKQSISIVTIEKYTNLFCNSPQISIVNHFNKKSMKWNWKYENSEKYLNYHGCELVLMLPIIQGSYSYHVWGHADIIQDKLEVYGIIPIIFKIASIKYNFKDFYQPVLPSSNKTLIYDENIAIVLVNGISKIPNVCIEVHPMHILQNRASYQMTSTFLQLTHNFLVTPAEAYTPYEKLLLPFDKDTWIYLTVTFLAVFFTIFIINVSPKFIQNVFYGDDVKTPSLNILSIFFGISQTRLPNENFSRNILLLFVFFCLIFRTCYQSMLFEFMTSEPRRPPPRTIKDLKERNYTLYTMEYETFNEMIQTEKENW